MPASGIRINKYLADQNICSRREAEQLVLKGWIQVNGQVLDDLAYRVQPDDKVEVSQQVTSFLDKKKTVIINKPVGYVSAQAEKDYTPAIRLIQKENYGGKGRAPHFELNGLAPAGRLDIDSKGLLILTQDGRLAKKVIGEDSVIEKEYLVRIEGNVTETVIRKLCHGLSLDGKKLKPAEVSLKSPQELRFILKEGRKRQIRRMCELVGLKVTSLKRIRIGKLRLLDLKEGQWRLLEEDEKI